jgi:hypothetical protein
MPYHEWEDDWFEKNGDDLNRAINYCCTTWRKYGRIGNHGKEKYGTFRDQLYPYTAEWPIHELVKPGHVYYRWTKWMMKVEIKLGKAVRLLRLHRPIQLYQRTVYNYAVQQACKKYPNIIDELVSDLDGYIWVKPGIFGPINGIEIHNKYWKRIV